MHASFALSPMPEAIHLLEYPNSSTSDARGG